MVGKKIKITVEVVNITHGNKQKYAHVSKNNDDVSYLNKYFREKTMTSSVFCKTFHNQKHFDQTKLFNKVIEY